MALQLQQCIAWYGCLVPEASEEKGTAGSCLYGDRVRLLLIPKRNKTSLRKRNKTLPKHTVCSLFKSQDCSLSVYHTPVICLSNSHGKDEIQFPMAFFKNVRGKKGVLFNIPEAFHISISCSSKMYFLLHRKQNT